MMAAKKIAPCQSLVTLLGGFVSLSVADDRLISGLQSDSRKITSGTLFLACSGDHQHGLQFASQAAEQGAVAIVYDPAGGGQLLAEQLKGELLLISVDELTEKIGVIASRFFGEPSQSLRVIGITGTNGKTSCSHLLAQALAGELACAAVGTLGWGSEGDWHETIHTTPDAVELNRIMAALWSEDTKVVALEVSSHGLVQGRTAGTHFEGALYTNFSRDHLDYHGNFDDYIEAKLRLLKSDELSFVAVNLDDDNASKLLDAVPETVVIWGFSQVSNSPHAGRCQHIVLMNEAQAGKEGLSFRVTYQEQSLLLTVPLIGHFNLENSLAVLTVLLAMAIPFERAVAALHRVKPIAGRMERISRENKPLVVVDYAHTPDALEKSLKSLKPHCEGSLKVVFGCGGDRDSGKRPLMGAIASQEADKVYLTDDNPRSENGDDIIAGIGTAGLDGVVVERDRRRAIERAINDSNENDVILVAGKGHETTQQIGDLKLPFDDREVVKKCLGMGCSQ